MDVALLLEVYGIQSNISKWLKRKQQQKTLR